MWVVVYQFVVPLFSRPLPHCWLSTPAVIAPQEGAIVTSEGLSAQTDLLPTFTHAQLIPRPYFFLSAPPGECNKREKKYIISSLCTRARRPRPLELFSMTCVLCCAVLCSRKKMPFSSSPPPAKAFLPSFLPPRLDGLSVACNLQAAKYCSSPPPPPLEAIWHSQYPSSFSENKAPAGTKSTHSSPTPSHATTNHVLHCWLGFASAAAPCNDD